MNVGFDGSDGAVDDEADSDGGREVKDDIRLVDEFGHEWFVEDASDGVGEAGCAQVDDVAEGSGGEIVKDGHGPAFAQAALGQVGADEAGSSCDEDVHIR